MHGKLRDDFIDFYRDLFAHMELLHLVEFEENLGAMIDSDLALEFILLDEIMLLYDLIRDECVKRCAIRCRSIV